MIKLEKAVAFEHTFYRFVCDEEHRWMPTFKASNGWTIESSGYPCVKTEIIYIIGYNKDRDSNMFEIPDKHLPFVEEAINEFNEFNEFNTSFEEYISIKKDDLNSFKINDEQLPFVEEAIAEFNASLPKKEQEIMEGYISIKKADLVEVIWGICLSEHIGDVWDSVKPLIKALGIEDYHPASLLDKMKKMGLIPDYHRKK